VRSGSRRHRQTDRRSDDHITEIWQAPSAQAHSGTPTRAACTRRRRKRLRGWQSGSIDLWLPRASVRPRTRPPCRCSRPRNPWRSRLRAVTGSSIAPLACLSVCAPGRPVWRGARGEEAAGRSGRVQVLAAPRGHVVQSERGRAAGRRAAKAAALRVAPALLLLLETGSQRASSHGELPRPSSGQRIFYFKCADHGAVPWNGVSWCLAEGVSRSAGVRYGALLSPLLG
jgi:hypothetical protein